MAETFEYTIRIQLPEGASPKLKDRLLVFAAECEFGMRIFAIKNHEYGDTFKYVGVRGITYDILGASARLHHLVNKVDPSTFPPPDAWSEMVGDVLVDIFNFSAMGGMLLREHNINGEY